MQKNDTYILGIDGGGTRTVICVADERYNILHRFESGALNVNGQTVSRLRETIGKIHQQLKQLNFKSDYCIEIGIGCAGITNPDASKLLCQQFQSFGFQCPIRIFGDHETALAAAFWEYHGIILIAGTGSICYGRASDGREFRSGGYGYLIDDAGSAYKIARDMLLAVVRENDFRGEQTILKDLILQKMDLESVEQLIGVIYRSKSPKSQIASLAPLLEIAVRSGDQAAIDIERNNADELVKLVVSVADRMPEEKDVAFSGSVLIRNSRLSDLVSKALKKYDTSFHIFINLHEPAEGAIRLLEKGKTGGC